MDKAGSIALITDLGKRVQSAYGKSTKIEARDQAATTLKGLQAFQRMIENAEPLFTFEPWHLLDNSCLKAVTARDTPAEMLLRLKDGDGAPIPPYPFIMTLYECGCTSEIDTLLFMQALDQFIHSDEHTVSINISARSLRNTAFIKTALASLERARLRDGRAVIFEIHESTPNLIMSAHVLQLFREFGAHFALDDVGMSLGDVFRLSEFESIADFVKLDRKTVCTPFDEPQSLGSVMAFVRSMLPHAIIIAEGVQSVAHAYEIHENFPDITYVQGIYLPDRITFAQEWQNYSAIPKVQSA